MNTEHLFQPIAIYFTKAGLRHFANAMGDHYRATEKTLKSLDDEGRALVGDSLEASLATIESEIAKYEVILVSMRGGQKIKMSIKPITILCAVDQLYHTMQDLGASIDFLWGSNLIEYVRAIKAPKTYA